MLIEFCKVYYIYYLVCFTCYILVLLGMESLDAIKIETGSEDGKDNLFFLVNCAEHEFTSIKSESESDSLGDTFEEIYNVRIKSEPSWDNELETSCTLRNEVKREQDFQTKNEELQEVIKRTKPRPKKLKEYHCPECEFHTKHRSSLLRHVTMHKYKLSRTTSKKTLSKKGTTYNCLHCTFQSNHRSHFYQHCLIHKGPDEIIMYGCYNCSFRTKYKSHLRTHMLVHRSPEEIEMQQCSICSFQTKHRSTLSKHMLAHTTKLEYKCAVCLWEAKSQYYLKQHMKKVHKNEMPKRVFNCDKCDYQTNRENYLKNHMASHSSNLESIKSCSYCPFQSKRYCHMTEHMSIVHNRGQIPKPESSKRKSKTSVHRSGINDLENLETMPIVDNVSSQQNTEIKDALQENNRNVLVRTSRVRTKPNYLNDYVKDFKV